MRLQHYVLRLVEKRFKTAADIWSIQDDALNHQLHLCRLLAQAKSRASAYAEVQKRILQTKEGDWKRHLRRLSGRRKRILLLRSIYEYTYALSKRFGDALAHVVFHRNERLMYALAQNHDVTRLPIERGSVEGVLAAGSFLANQGLGFPILHDITNWLRIGDLTFIHKHHKPLTVEIKTRLTREQGDTIDATVTFACVPDPEQQSFLDNICKNYKASDQNPTSEPADRTVRPPRYARFDRQLERMRKAVADASPDKPHLDVEILHDDDITHIHLIKHLICEARSKRFAFAKADDSTFIYVAAHEMGIRPWKNTISKFDLDRLPPALVESGIFLPNRDDNFPMLSTSPEQFSAEVHPLLKPLYLAGFSATDLFDLAYGRVVVATLVNLGRVAKNLRELGYDVQLTPNSPRHDYLSISKVVRIAGASRRVGIRNTRLLVQRITHEYQKSSVFIRAIDQTVMDSVELMTRRAS